MRRALLRVELTRLLRDPVTLLVVVGLPLVFYLGFSLGVPVPGADRERVRAALMVGMAAYGAATAAANIAGQAAVDRAQGWGRQLALTPLRDADLVLVKTGVAVGAGLAPTAAVFAAGALTGVRMGAAAWAGSAAVVVLGASMWALYGLAAGLMGRTQSAIAGASAGLVLLGFVGDVFLPLTGALQRVGQWTPMYGYVQFARFPLDGGRPLLPGQYPDARWQVLANVVLWALVFAVLALREVARSRER